VGLSEHSSEDSSPQTLTPSASNATGLLSQKSLPEFSKYTRVSTSWPLRRAPVRLFRSTRFFHVACGRWIASHGLPTSNVFLQFETERAFIDNEWLFQLVLAGLHGIGGFPAVSLIKLLAVLGLAALVLALSPQRRGALLSLSLFLIAAHPRFIARPELISMLALTATIALHEHLRVLRISSRRLLLSVFGLQLIWANSHGLSILGPAVSLCYLAQDAVLRLAPKWRRSLRLSRGGPPAPRAAILGIQLLASLLNPYGLRGALEPFRKLGAAAAAERGRILELEAPFADIGSASLDVWAILTLLVLTGLALLWQLYRRQLSLAQLGLALGLGFAGTQATRLIPFAALGLLPLLRAGAQDYFRARPGYRVAAIAAGLGFVSYTLLLSLSGRLHSNGLFEARLGLNASETFQYRGLKDYWTRRPPKDPYFNTFGAGHWLIYANPEASPRPFICGLTDLYSKEFYDLYWELINLQRDFTATATSLGLGEVFIDHRTSPALVEVLARDRRWRLVYLDHQAALFRSSGLNEPSALEQLAEIEKNCPSDRMARLHLAQALSLWPSEECQSLARKILQSLSENEKDWFPAEVLLARIELLSGDRQRACEAFEKLSQSRPRDAALALSLANARLLLGQAEAAAEAFQRALALGASPRAAEQGLCQAWLQLEYLPELRRLLASSQLPEAWRAYFRGRAAAREDDFERAKAEYKKAWPEVAEAGYVLAELLFRSGDSAAARPVFEDYLARQRQDGEAWEYLGACCFKLKDFEASVRAWERSWELRPNRPQAAMNLARANITLEGP
jgi:Flp pilus assembly protein TadD